MTAADQVAGGLVALATAFLAWRGLCLGGSLTATLPWVLAGAAIVTIQAQVWMRAVRQPARRLVACGDGSLWLHTASRAPCRLTMGAGTRLVGPSVFLDLNAPSHSSAQRIRTWLTPFDVPAPAIRRWSVLLPRSGRVARS